LSELKLAPAAGAPQPVAPAAPAATAPSTLHEAAAQPAGERAAPSPSADLAAARPADRPAPAHPAAGAGPGPAAATSTSASSSSAPHGVHAPHAPAAAAPAKRPTVSTPESRVIADLDETFAFIARQASEEAAAPKAPPPAAELPAPATEGTPRVPVESLLQTLLATRRGRWVLAGLLVLLVAATIAALVWQWLDSSSGLPGDSGIGAAGPALAAPGAPAGRAGAAALPALPPLPPLPQAPTAAGPPPVAKEPATAAPPPAKPAAALPSPNARCGAKTGYALFECMKEQCAKRAYRQHAQCVRLRKEQRLSWQAPAGPEIGGRLAAEQSPPAIRAGFSLPPQPAPARAAAA
jgi:hypothetical protein